MAGEGLGETSLPQAGMLLLGPRMQVYFPPDGLWCRKPQLGKGLLALGLPSPPQGIGGLGWGWACPADVHNLTVWTYRQGVGWGLLEGP